MDLWIHWAYYGWTRVKHFIDYLNLEAPSVTGGPQWPFESPGFGVPFE